MKSTTVPVAPNSGDAPRSHEQSLLYKAVMTPIIFVTFLISLLLVDLRYAAMRSHFHPEEYSTNMPRWLHRIIYRYQPYQYVTVGKDGQRTTSKGYADFYHSKQKKLMKMEVDDAFQIRGTVVVILGVLGVVIAWGTVWVGMWLGRVVGIW